MSDTLILLAVIIPAIIVVVLISLVAIKIRKKQKVRRADIPRDKILKDDDFTEIDEDQKNVFLEKLGGDENLLEVTQEMSRVTFVVDDLDKVDFDGLKSLGASGILVMGNQVKCSFRDQADYIYFLMKKDWNDWKRIYY